MEQWYAFRAYNTETLYGYGTADEAEAFADILNAKREVNVYGAYPMTGDDAEKLDARDDTFRLDDELAARADRNGT